VNLSEECGYCYKVLREVNNNGVDEYWCDDCKWRAPIFMCAELPAVPLSRDWAEKYYRLNEVYDAHLVVDIQALEDAGDEGLAGVPFVFISCEVVRAYDDRQRELHHNDKYYETNQVNPDIVVKALEHFHDVE
jgi:hypothetical protein